MTAINHDYKSNNRYSPRTDSVKFLVLHFTGVPLGTTFGIMCNNFSYSQVDHEYFANSKVDPVALCQRQASSHYVVAETGELYQVVAEEDAAWHSGDSNWNGVHKLNNHSIGIELENIGYDWLNKFPHEREVIVPGSDLTWCNFSADQIATTITLCKDIISRYDIQPYNVIGHSDIACGVKQDPGPVFPWELFAANGIGMWYDLSESKFEPNYLPDNPVLWFQTKLIEFGYACPITGVVDKQTSDTVQAFQMHFRQNNIDGSIDLECIQILDSLCQRKLAYSAEQTKENRILNSTNIKC